MSSYKHCPCHCSSPRPEVCKKISIYISSKTMDVSIDKNVFSKSSSPCHSQTFSVFTNTEISCVGPSHPKWKVRTDSRCQDSNTRPWPPITSSQHTPLSLVNVSVLDQWASNKSLKIKLKYRKYEYFCSQNRISIEKWSLSCELRFPRLGSS